MCRLKITAMLALLLVTGLLAACGSQATNEPGAGSTPTPRAATDADVTLLKEIFQTNAEQVKSYHQVMEVRGDLYAEPGTEPPITRLETDVESPGKTHTWGQHLGKPSEVYVLDGIPYMKDSTGEWVEQESTLSDEMVGGTLLVGSPRQLEEADWIRVLDPGETINGVVTQQFVWEMHETSGWFTGGTFTYSVWVDPKTRYAQKRESCLWVMASNSATPGAGKDVRRESCTTTVYTRHNEKLSIGALPFADLRSAPETNTTVVVSEPPCGIWNIRSAPGEKNAAAGYTSFSTLAAISPDDVWVAGTKMEHWNGKEWTSYPFPVAGHIEIADLAAISQHDVWAVGTVFEDNGRGLALHWDGKAWQETSPKGFILLPQAVDGTGANDVWAVGYNNYLNRHEGIQTMHWDGKTWRDVPVPNRHEQTNPPFDTGELRDVVAISQNDVWAVGKTVDRLYLVIHWDGSAWAEVPMPEPSTSGYGLDGVSASSPNDIWAVPGFWHWDGKVWMQAPFEAKEAQVGPPSAISALSADNAWAVGYSGVWHWDGTMWRTVLNPVADLIDDYEKTVRVNGRLTAVDARQEGSWITGPAKSDRLMVAHFTPGECGR